MAPGFQHLDSNMDPALAAWRRKATDVVLAAGVIAFLPAVLLFGAGRGPAVSGTARALLTAGYLVCVAAALLRPVSHSVRLWTTLGMGYVLSVIMQVAVRESPLGRALVVFAPILALVLLGRRSGRVATVLSMVALLATPLLQHVPGVVRTMGAQPYWTPLPAGMSIVQGIGLTGVLVTLMVVLELFHSFLIGALMTQRDAAAELERETARRIAGHQSLEQEMVERRRLEREIAETGDQERRRLGHDVHDGVCQQLTAAMLRCQTLERQLERDRCVAPEDLSALSSLLEEAIDDAHAVARGLCPLDDDPGALVSGLRTLARRTQAATGVRCEFAAAGDVRVTPSTMAQHLYRIAQEALSNASRHAQANSITLELRGCSDEVLLRVQDDGAGLPPDCPSGGLGMRTMRYRAQMMGGELDVESVPEGGTRVVCRVPRGGVAAQGGMDGA